MRPRALVAVVAVVVAPIVSAQGDARSIADRAVREEGGEVCAAVVLPSFGDPPVSILALYDAGRRGLCDLILRIAPGNPPQIIERIKISFLRTFDTVLQDLDHNGDLEVVVPDRWGGGRHYRCEPEKSVVYRCDRAQCTDASASFPSFFTKELAAVNRNLARLKNMTSDAEVAEWRCVTLERDRLMRLLKIDPRAGFAMAEQWMRSADHDDRLDAVSVFTNIGDAASKANLQLLVRDPDTSVAIMARAGLGLPLQP